MLKEFETKEREFKMIEFQGREIKIYTTLPLEREMYFLNIVEVLAIKNGVRNPASEKVGFIIALVENFVDEEIIKEVEELFFTDKAQIYLDSGLYQKVKEVIGDEKYLDLSSNINKYLESKTSLGASLTEVLLKIDEIVTESVPNLIESFSTFLNEENIKKIDGTIDLLKKMYKE